MVLKYEKTGRLAHPEDREAQVMQYLPFVKRTVRRLAAYLPAHVDTDDLMSAGIVGLMEALDRYDPETGHQFLTFAGFRIRGAVLSELRARDFLSRGDRKRVRAYRESFGRLEAELGRTPEENELAEALEIDIETLQDIRRLSDTELVSFEEIGVDSSEDRRSVLENLQDTESPDALAMTRLKEMTRTVADGIEKLTRKEQLVISMYYQDEMTMKEIGEVLEITESRVSQIHTKAVFKLRGVLTRKGLLDA